MLSENYQHETFLKCQKLLSNALKNNTARNNFTIKKKRTKKSMTVTQLNKDNVRH